jgi:NADH-quinone oxidoreductase subunit H
VITSLAETNRPPFDLVEAEAELVAGYHVEYSSVFFALIFIAEYGNILLMSAIATIFFFGGWIPPFCASVEELLRIDAEHYWYSGFVFAVKTSCNVFIFILVRATVPRYRYDQLMQLGWKVLIPMSLSMLVLQCLLIEVCAM